MTTAVAVDAHREAGPHTLRRHGRTAAGDRCRLARLRDAHRPRPIPDPALALIGQGVTVVAATRDAAMRPHIARAWGPEVLGERGPLRLCIEASERSATAQNLVERPEIAATFTRPSTYQSVQLKGLTLEVRPPTDDELGLVDEHQAAFAAEVEKVGIQLRLVPRLLDRSSLVSVSIAVDELYDQTPGRAAGTPL
ncbi:MAG TPA: pyridoxamine 5'-phosphate oxidase family protein [Solirubrobacteraceae bacterium]|nr:pyridoxamine 5'-phosphate oxidase family protein [Solirubrobacteraceae bacterium]